MLEQIKPWIMLNDNTTIQMTLSKKDGNLYCFEDDQGRAHLKLAVKESGNIKAIFIDAGLEPAEYQYSKTLKIW